MCSRCSLFHVSLSQLKSYVGNIAAKEKRALTGYCQYYFNHYDTDPHILDNSTEDTLQKVFLSIAIIFLWLIIAISVPAALYTVILIKTGKKSTTEPSLTTEQTATEDEWQNRSTKLARGVIKILVKTRDSSDVYYIIAVFTIAPFLDISIIGLNVWLLMNCKFAWFILCFDAVFIVLSIFEVGWISALALYYRTELDTWRAILYAAGIFSLVIALQLLTFHGTFILVVFIFSPIPTACFTLIYISASFSMLTAVSTVIKVIHKCREKKVNDRKCHYAFQIVGAILFAICVLSFDALFFTTLVRARHDYFGVSGFFGALVPTAIIAIISFTGNMLIENDDNESNTGFRHTVIANKEEDSNSGPVYRAYGTCIGN